MQSPLMALRQAATDDKLSDTRLFQVLDQFIAANIGQFPSIRHVGHLCLSHFSSGQELDFHANARVYVASNLRVKPSEPGLDWARSIPANPQDALILVGDVCTGPRLLRNILLTLKNKFKHVIFMPGNEELKSRK